MTGMTTIGATSLSSYNNRTITIAISGLCNQATSRHSNYVIQIPYSRLNSTLQSVRRSGAQITSITLNGQPAPSQANPIETVIEPVIETVIEPVIEAVIEPVIEAIEPVIETVIEPTIANPAPPIATRPAATSRVAQPVAHGHGFRVDSDPKKSKKRKR
jgi:phycocyanin-associated, rod